MKPLNDKLLKENKHEAYDYLTKFSSFLRENLKMSKDSFTSLEDEIQLLNQYLELEKLRFGNDFQYEIEEFSDKETIKIINKVIDLIDKNIILHIIIKGSKISN